MSSQAAAELRYDRNTLLLHWATAVLVALLWGIAQVIDFFPRGTARIAPRSVHILLGATLAVVLLVRLYWRFTSGRRLPMSQPGWIGYSSKLVHYGLYALIGATLIAGIANVWVRGENIFGLLQVPAYAPDDRALRRSVGSLHGTLANAVLIVAGLHTLAALLHHYVLKDGVLRRMLPARAER